MITIPDRSKLFQEKIEEFLGDHLLQGPYGGAVIGISGGLDSAVAAALCRRVLPRDKIRLFFLPERDSDPSSEREARVLARHLGLELITRDLTPALQALDLYKNPAARLVKNASLNRLLYRFTGWLGGDDPFKLGLGPRPSPAIRTATSFYRSKHRLRMTCLFYQAENLGYAVVGALNRSELLTGFFVYHGDDAAHLAPLLPLYKTEVIYLARQLQIPQSLIEKPPSPDLIPGLDDKFILGLDYELLDQILWALEEGYEEKRIADILDISPDRVSRLQRLLQRSRETKIPHYPRELRQVNNYC